MSASRVSDRRPGVDEPRKRARTHGDYREFTDQSIRGLIEGPFYAFETFRFMRATRDRSRGLVRERDK